MRCVSRRLRTIVNIVLLLTVPCSAARAQEAPRTPTVDIRAARAVRPPVIDGKLNDEAWAAASPVSGFTQRDPDEGKPATEDTEIRILYDDTALYIGARLLDD